MSHRFRSEVIKLSVFAVVAVLITVSVIATLLDLKLGQTTRSYHAIFVNASGLEAGDTVRIAGVEVGKVNSVSLDGYKAKVDFTVDASQHLSTTTTASIQFQNLLGQRYLQIEAGKTHGSPLRSGSTIPIGRTTPGLDLTTVFSGFQPLLAALNPKQVNELTGSIIAVLQGESGAAGDLVKQTTTLTQNLVSRQGLINQVLDNLTPLLKSVNADDAQLGQLIDGLDSLVSNLAGKHNELGNAISGLSQLTTATSHLLDQVQPTLDQDLSSLEAATAELSSNQGRIDGVLVDLPTLLTALDKASSSGSYIGLYVCNLTVHTSGPVSVKLSPTVPQSPALSIPQGLVGGSQYHTAVCQ